jgi:uncharacterized protein (TIGR00251 family)
MAFYKVENDGIVLAVRLTPRGGRDAVDRIVKLSDGREVAGARVRAVADNGAANLALVALLATVFDRPREAVTILSGITARLKQVRIAGDPTRLAAIAKGWPR